MKWAWPAGLIIFFALFIGGIVFFVVWSTHQREDLVANNYYEQELQYQKRIDAVTRTSREGLKPAVAYDNVAHNLNLQFPVTEIHATTGTVTLYRPSNADQDRAYALAMDGGGGQSIGVVLASGLWRVKLEWVRDNQSYFAEEAIMVP